jgi:hypothetical protein
MVHAYNPSPRDAKSGGWKGRGQPVLTICEFETSLGYIVRHCLKKKFMLDFSFNSRIMKTYLQDIFWSLDFVIWIRIWLNGLYDEKMRHTSSFLRVFQMHENSL